MKRQKSEIVEIFVLKIMNLKTYFLILEQIFLNCFFSRATLQDSLLLILQNVSTIGQKRNTTFSRQLITQSL
jgi:hypothetical protein